MKRIVNFITNNIREHFMLWLVLWALVALIDMIYVFLM